VDNNRQHPLYAYADAVIKIHYPRMRMWIAVLGYADAVNNHIHIPFIYNIYYIYLIKFTKMRSF